MRSTSSNSIPLTSASFQFSHRRLSQKWPLSNFSTKSMYQFILPPICAKYPSPLLPHSVATKIMNPSVMRLSPASCYFLLLMLMMIMMVNVALPSGVRIRYRPHICTSIIPMIPTRGEKHSFHLRTVPIFVLQ